MAGSPPRSSGAPHVCCLSGQRLAYAPCLHCDIRHLSVCGALNAAGLAELQRQVGHECFEPGRTIVTEGEAADRAFILLSGMVSLSKAMPDGRRQILGFLLPGDFIGIAEDDHRYCHTAETVIRTELCGFRTQTLERLADRHPEFRRRLMGTIASEMCAAQEHMLWVGRKSALERVASFLVTLARRLERRGGRRNDVRLPMTRRDIADCLGLTEASVTRSLGQLARKGLVWVPRPHEVIILRREPLEAVAEGSAAVVDRRTRSAQVA